MSSTRFTGPKRGRSRHRLPAVAMVAVLAVASLATPAHAAPSGVTTAYIANQFSSTISVLDTATGVTTATIPVTGYPTDLALNAAGTTLYSANEISSTVSVIDTATATVTATIPVGANPDAITLNPAGTTAYTANESSHTVSVIDTASDTVTATIPFAGYAFAMTLNPAGTTAYIATFSPNTLTVIDLASDTVTATVPLSGPAYAVTLDPAGTTAYVGTAQQNTITEVDTATDTVTGTIADPDITAMAFTPDGAELFAVSPNHHDVTIIDPATGTITATIPTGVDPQRVAVDAAGDTAYVTDIVMPNGSGTGHVFAIDVATDTVSTVTDSLVDPDAIALHTVPAPTVTSVSPNAGPLAAGTPVTITGTHLNGTTAITFGADGPATAVSCTATSCTATAPAGAAGTVDVRVTTPGGTSATSPTDQYTYIAAPVITAVSPTSGPPAGGTPVTITGANLTGAGIRFGADGPATAVSCTATSCTATAPAGTAGTTVDVQATTVGGTSATSPADQFTYAAADLAVTMTADGDPGILFAHIAYTLTVTNNGPSPLASATITAPLPTPMTADTTDCTTSGNLVTCTIGALAAGASTTRHFTVPIGLLTLNHAYTVTAARTASTPIDPNPANDSATRTCTIITSLIIDCE